MAVHLESEGALTDTVARSQIQAEAMYVGAAMQHLGAMLLELGRTIMTLRMGHSPVCGAYLVFILWCQKNLGSS